MVKCVVQWKLFCCGMSEDLWRQHAWDTLVIPLPTPLAAICWHTSSESDTASFLLRNVMVWKGIVWKSIAHLTQIQLFQESPIHTHTHTHIHAQTCTYTHTHTHATQTHTYTHTQHKHTHTRTHTHIHTHTHTHTTNTHIHTHRLVASQPHYFEFLEKAFDGQCNTEIKVQCAYT